MSLALLAVAACGKGRDWRQTPAQTPAVTDAEAGYVRPPQVLSAQRGGDGMVVLSGRAEPNSRVRLMTPEGAAYGGTVTAAGVWSMPMPAGTGIYGLSEDLGGRVVQSEGYIVLLAQPGQPAALMRAGGGALVLGAAPMTLTIAAVDFDGGGGTVVSGFAPAGSSLRLTVDGAAAPGDVKTDAGGRFVIGSPVMLRPGSHQIRVQSAIQAAAADVAVGPAGPISGSPYRAARQGGAWRVDWTTPGGGVQTSLILDP